MMSLGLLPKKTHGSGGLFGTEGQPTDLTSFVAWLATKPATDIVYIVDDKNPQGTVVTVEAWQAIDADAKSKKINFQLRDANIKNAPALAIKAVGPAGMLHDALAKVLSQPLPTQPVTIKADPVRTGAKVVMALSAVTAVGLLLLWYGPGAKKRYPHRYARASR